MSVQRVIVQADIEEFDFSGLAADGERRARRFLQNCIGKTPDEVLRWLDAIDSNVDYTRALVAERFKRRAAGLRLAK